MIDGLLHDVDIHLNWCRRCGRPMLELFEQQIGLCDGLPGVTHRRYLQARDEARKLFDPISKSLGLLDP